MDYWCAYFCKSSRVVFDYDAKTTKCMMYPLIVVYLLVSLCEIISPYNQSSQDCTNKQSKIKFKLIACAYGEYDGAGTIIKLRWSEAIASLFPMVYLKRSRTGLLVNKTLYLRKRLLYFNLTRHLIKLINCKYKHYQVGISDFIHDKVKIGSLASVCSYFPDIRT